MARKRKRPIEPTSATKQDAVQMAASTSAPGSSASGGGARKHVQSEGEEIELRQAEAPDAIEELTIAPQTREIPPEVDDAFRQAVHELPADRQMEQIRKRKRAA